MTEWDTPAAFVAQMLLRASIWALAIVVAGTLARSASAARRVALWRTGLIGLLLLPICLAVAPPLPILPTAGVVQPARREDAPVSARSAIVNDTAAQNDPAQGVLRAERSNAALSSSEAPRTAVLRRDPPAAPPQPLSRGSASLPAPAQSGSQVLSALRSALSAQTLLRTLFVLWLAGALWSSARLLASLASLRRLGRAKVDAPPDLQAHLTECARQAAVGAPVSLRIRTPRDTAPAPLTWGLFRPVLVLPAGCEQSGGAWLRTALLHELAHVKAHDWAWLVCARWLCAVYWCVPFVRTAASRLHRDSELACDDRVLSFGVPAAEYAAQILEIARAWSGSAAV